jgi:O-antigen/teichoic acid export membrane protein
VRIPVEKIRLLTSLLGRQSLEGNRSLQRYRNVLLTGVTASAGRVISIVTSILTVRLTYNYLGAERYGMWMTITSVIAMFGFADLGLNNGLINMVATATGREDAVEARKAVSSTFLLLSVAAAALTVVCAAIYGFIAPERLFNVTSVLAVREAGPALVAFFLCFVVQLPLGSIRGTQSGLQKGFHNNLWAALGTAGALVAMLVAVHRHFSLPLLVLCVSGPPVIAALLNGVELFGFSHRELRPSVAYFSRDAAREGLRTGLMYFLLQISFTIGTQTDNVVIAQIMGASSVAAYAVPARMFNLVTSFLVMVSGAMLPAYAEAQARGDYYWVRKSFFRVLLFGTVCTLAAAFILVLFGNRVLALWIGPGVQASLPLLAVLGLQCVIYAYLQPIAFLLNGLGQFRAQVICALINALVNLGLTIVFVRRYGIVGAVMGTTISFLFVAVIPLTIETVRVLKNMRKQEPRVSDAALP